MSTFLNKVEKDFDTAKKNFNSWLDKVDGTDEFKALQEKQNQELEAIVASVPADLQPELKKKLSAFAQECFENGFSQGFEEGSLSCSTEIE